MNPRTVSRSRLQSRCCLLKRMEVFLANKDTAIRAAKRGDRDGARFWGQQARIDWAQIARVITSPAL